MSERTPQPETVRECPQCHGVGTCSSPDAGWLTTSYQCRTCHGTGTITAALEPGEDDGDE